MGSRWDTLDQPDQVQGFHYFQPITISMVACMPAKPFSGKVVWESLKTGLYSKLKMLQGVSSAAKKKLNFNAYKMTECFEVSTHCTHSLLHPQQ